VPVAVLKQRNVLIIDRIIAGNRRPESRRFTIIIMLITGIIVIMDRAIIVNISNAPLKKSG
jgi:hypothetical protein